jgi:hypothetical protein
MNKAFAEMKESPLPPSTSLETFWYGKTSGEVYRVHGLQLALQWCIDDEMQILQVAAQDQNAGVEEGENPFNPSMQTLEAVDWNAPITKVLVERDDTSRQEEHPVVDEEAF